MAKLYYQGHGSYRITTNNKTVIYVDPYAGDGYDIPADMILVTHDHYDHNNVSLVRTLADTKIITAKDALQNGQYQRFSIKDVQIDAVPAYNHNHKREECVGYVLYVDEISIYAAGDTSRTDAMSTLLPKYHLDYALLPIDGIYNMDAAEATACAQSICLLYTSDAADEL